MQPRINPAILLTPEEEAELDYYWGEFKLFDKCFLTIASHAHCPEAEGFEGADTFPSCGKCFICYCKKPATGA